MDTGLATTTILAGETLEAELSFDDYPAGDGITLKYLFRAGATRDDISAVADGTDWTLTVPATDTIRWEPGDCFFSAMYTDADGVVTEIDSGAFVVRMNPSIRSHAERTLDAIQAVMEGRAKSDQLTVTLGDVSLQYMSPVELSKWEDIFAARVNAERDRLRRERGYASRRRVGTMFV